MFYFKKHYFLKRKNVAEISQVYLHFRVETEVWTVSFSLINQIE